MILQARPDVITNLFTDKEPSKYVEYFRQETIMPAKNIFSAAEEALKIQSTLKKVMILKLIPRYDPKTADPLTLKSALSLLFNNKLTEL